MDDDRVRIEVRLVGTSSLEGEISLKSLGALAEHTHELVVRMTRAMTGREGPGRTPSHLGQEVQLSLSGIRAGSTVLELVGPAQASFDLGADLDLPRRVFTEVIDGFAAVAEDRDPPPSFTPKVKESLRHVVQAMSEAGEVHLSAVVGGAPREVRLDPSGAQRVLSRSQGPDHPPAEPSEVSVQGTVVLVDLDSQRFAVRDDIGNRVLLHPGELPVAAITGLIGRRVSAAGIGALGADGVLRDITLSAIEGADGRLAFDDSAFRVDTSLDSLLRGVEPLDPRTLDMGLDEAEAGAFLASIREGR